MESKRGTHLDNLKRLKRDLPSLQILLIRRIHQLRQILKRLLSAPDLDVLERAEHLLRHDELVREPLWVPIRALFDVLRGRGEPLERKLVGEEEFRQLLALVELLEENVEEGEANLALLWGL